MDSQFKAALDADKAAAAWVDQGELLDMAYIRRHGLSQYQVGQMVRKRYPELNRHNDSPVIEKLWKGRLVVVLERRQFCLYRWGHHHKTVRTYAVKDAQGKWDTGYARLADIPPVSV